MPRYKVRSPDGQEFEVDGPEGSTIEDAYAYVQENLWKPRPEGGFGTAVMRGAKQLGSLVGDVLPAMAAKAVGADEYAARQMAEYKATEQEIADKYAARVPSYKDIKSAGDALTYVTESIGELLPSMIPSLLTGGVGGVAARGMTAAAQKAAQQAAKEVAEREVARAVSKNVLTAETLKGIEKAALDAGAKKAAEIAAKATTRGQAVGVGVGSAAQNIPEVYTNVYEAVDGQVGGKELATALAFGSFNAALDSILPAGILQKITKSGIPKEEVAAAWLKRGAKGLATGFAKEGGTEAIQEMSSAAAEKFVNENKNFFTEENFERFLNAGIKGGIGGGVATGVADIATGKGPEKVGTKAQQAIEKTLADQKVIEEEKQAETLDTGLEDVADLDKAISELNLPKEEAAESTEEVELKTPIKPSVNIDAIEPPSLVSPEVVKLTPEAMTLLDVASTGAIPQKSDKQLKKIAVQNGIEFNPAVDTVQDLVDRLKEKINVSARTRREDSGVGAEVSGQPGAGAAEATTAPEPTRLVSDEGISGADKGGAGAEQLTLEEQDAVQAELADELEANAPKITKPKTEQEKVVQDQKIRKAQANPPQKLTPEEQAAYNYMMAAGSRSEALRYLAGDIYSEAKVGENAPNTGGKFANAFYKSLSGEQKAKVDQLVENLRQAEARWKTESERMNKRQELRAAEEAQFESDEDALMRRTRIYGATTPKLIRAVFLGDTRAALQEIATNPAYRQLDRMIAKRILDSKTFPEIEIVPAETLVDEKGRQASGQYVTQSDTAQIADGEVDSHSVLHEISHGYLHALIRGFQAGKIENKGLTQLNELYTFLKENHPELEGQYGMKDLSEFASEMMSNPDFQLQLSKIPYQRVNAFTAFAQAVLRIMGIDPNEKATALAAGLIAIDKTIPQGRLYQDNAITGKVVMPPPKVIKPGEEADIEGMADEGMPKKAPREKQTYENALGGLEKDVESKEGVPQLKKLFTTREGWHWWVRKFQNSREVLRRIQRALERNGLLISQGDKRNDVAAQFDSSSALADKYYRERLQNSYKDINTLAAEYAAASGQTFERAMAQLHLYAELKHEPERRHVLYLLNVPLNDQAAALRKEILKRVSNLKGDEKQREASAKQYRALLEKLVSDKKNLKDPLSNENQDRYNVIADRGADEVRDIKAEMMANPQVADHIDLIESIMTKVQDVNKTTADLNQIGHYWSLPVDNIVKFYGYENYVPFKGRPDQATKNDIADPFSKRMAGDFSEGQDAAQGRVTEAENIILRVMAEGVKSALRAGRKDLTLSIKNAVSQGYLKGRVNPKEITGKEGQPVSFEDRYVLGKSIQELKKATNIFHYNDDGTIDVIMLTDPEQREAIRKTFQEAHPFVDMLNSFTSGMGQMHTRYNPAFGPINFAGDLLTNSFTMGAEFGPKATFDLLRTVAAQVGRGGLVKAGKAAFYYNQGKLSELRKYTDPKSPDYDEFYANLLEYLDRGGKVSYVQGFATKSQTDLARAEMRRAGKFATKKDIDDVVDVWTDMFELASRTAAYTVAKQKYMQENQEKGMDKAEAEADAKNRATYYAKNLANFEQVGEYGKTLGALYMFARPAATGAVRAIEALQPLMSTIANKLGADIPLTEKEKQQAVHARTMLIGLAGMGYAAYMMAYMMADDDDEGRNRVATDDMDRWVRYMRFTLPRWMTGEDDVIVQMRWGFGLGAFASAGAQVAGIIQGNSTIGKGLENIVEAGLDSFLPLPVSRISPMDNPAAWFMDTATPSAFRPFMEYVMNVDSLGREIYNNRMTRAGDAYTGGDNIPEIYKGAARMLFDTTTGGIDISPNTLYFFVNNYIDGVGKLASSGYNLGLLATGSKDFNPKTDTVIFDSFFGSPSNYDARKFSEAEKKIKETERRLKTLEKDPENYLKYMEKNPEAQFIVDYYNQAVNGTLKDLRAMANQVRSNRDMTPKERTEMIREIVRMQNMVKLGILNNFEAMGVEF